MSAQPQDDGRPAAVVDVDGTLVDSVYHHALAWHRAFVACGVTVPVWRIHRHIGMGGDQLVQALCGEDFEGESGDEAREIEKERFQQVIDEVQALDGARELLDQLKRRGHRLVLASSAKEDELEHYLDLLEARDIADDWTSSADVEATKPDPDLVQTALDKVGGGPAVMVGDSTWDARAAERAGLKTVGLLTGGFSEAELREAGADPVFESLGELRQGLDRTPLAA